MITLCSNSIQKRNTKVFPQNYFLFGLISHLPRARGFPGKTFEPHLICCSDQTVATLHQCSLPSHPSRIYAERIHEFLSIIICFRFICSQNSLIYSACMEVISYICTVLQCQWKFTQWILGVNVFALTII